METRVNTFLELAVKQGGSDLHLITGQTPRIRIQGVLHAIRFRQLSNEDLKRILAEFMTEDQWRNFEQRLAVDFAYETPELGRFRVNVYRHSQGLAAALRVIPNRVPTLEELELPASVALGASQSAGLTLVTGPTGSGKSTTLAALVDAINTTRRGHIITIEDPIEFVHPFKRCTVTQREIGFHSPSFSEALRDAVREDPDLILVGEMRDLETISLALTAAETGTQVFGTLHTSGASRSIDRIINVFPARRQEQVRAMLAESLRMIVSQKLVPTTEGNRRVPVAEVLVNTNAAASMIRTGNTHKLETVIQSGAGVGMQSLDGTLKGLLQRGVITGEEAHAHAIDKNHFERFVVTREAA